MESRQEPYPVASAAAVYNKWTAEDQNETLYVSNGSCSVCVFMHTYTIPPSNVRPFDIVLLIPNVMFLAYLLIKCGPTAKKLAGSLTLFKILYAVTFFIPVTGIMYAMCSMIFGRDHASAKVLNVICRSSVLLTELNVILFGVFFKDIEPRCVEDIEPRCVEDIEPRCVEDIRPRCVEDIEPRCVEDIEPRCVEDIEPRCVEDIEPRCVEDIEPRCVEDIEPRCVEDIEPRCVEDIEWKPC
eukprot:Em0001g1552a